MAKKKLKLGEWSKDEVRRLKALYRNYPTRQVAMVMRRPYEAVKRKASRLGLRKTRKYMKTLGR